MEKRRIVAYAVYFLIGAIGGGMGRLIAWLIEAALSHDPLWIFITSTLVILAWVVMIVALKIAKRMRLDEIIQERNKTITLFGPKE